MKMKSLAKTFAYGSAVLAVVIASSLSGCSSSDSKDTGAAGSGGSGTGGTSGGSTGGTSSAGHAGTSNGTGGSAIGAAGADTTGMGGSGGSDTTGAAGADTMGNAGADTMGAAGASATGAAVGKFCNTVQFGTQADPMDITLRLEIGTAPNVVTIEALSGTCVPTTGACKSLPLGTDVPVKLIDPAASNAVLDSATVTISDGDEFVFYSDIDTDAPVIRGGTLDTAQGTCSDFQYSQL
jgi:hypothetical protein